MLRMMNVVPFISSLMAAERRISAPSIPLHTATAVPTPALQTDNALSRSAQDALLPTPQSRTRHFLTAESTHHARGETQPPHLPAIRHGTRQRPDAATGSSQ